MFSLSRRSVSKCRVEARGHLITARDSEQWKALAAEGENCMSENFHPERLDLPAVPPGGGRPSPEIEETGRASWSGLARA